MVRSFYFLLNFQWQGEGKNFWPGRKFRHNPKYKKSTNQLNRFLFIMKVLRMVTILYNSNVPMWDNAPIFFKRRRKTRVDSGASSNTFYDIVEGKTNENSELFENKGYRLRSIGNIEWNLIGLRITRFPSYFQKFSLPYCSLIETFCHQKMQKITIGN